MFRGYNLVSEVWYGRAGEAKRERKTRERNGQADGKAIEAT